MIMTQHDLYRIREGALMDSVEEFNRFFNKVSKKLIEDLYRDKEITVNEKARRYGLYLKIKDLKIEFSYEDDIIRIYYRLYRELVIAETYTFKKRDQSFLETIGKIRENVMSEAKYQTLIQPREFERIFSKLEKAVKDFTEI